MIVKTDPVLEAIARKLHGIENVPPMEQAAMIRRAAEVAREAVGREAAGEMREEAAKIVDGHAQLHRDNGTPATYEPLEAAARRIRDLPTTTE